MKDTNRRRRFRRDLLSWGEENVHSYPWREPDATAYEVLVAEIMLKQTRRPTVERVYREFVEEFPTLRDLALANRETIVDVIEPLGLYNYRADAYMEIAESFGNQKLPCDEEGLRELPQVGPYIANAVLCFAYGQPRAFVDTNVRRIYERVFYGGQSSNPEDDELWNLAGDMVPEDRSKLYNSALLDFGADVCTQESPDCQGCFASDYCLFYQERNDC